VIFRVGPDLRSVRPPGVRAPGGHFPMVRQNENDLISVRGNDISDHFGRQYFFDRRRSLGQNSLISSAEPETEKNRDLTTPEGQEGTKGHIL
jgi:hypothetical protein